MRRILLVRHGESEWNALGRWQGRADPPLSDHGRHQAASAARALGSVDAIVTSSLQRAQHTAEILSAELGVGPVAIDERLVERDAGEWSGLTRAEIHAGWPGYLADDPAHQGSERRPPGWEPDDDLLVRAQEALWEFAEDLAPGASAIAVTHGGVIYAIEAALGGPRLYLPNLGSRWLTFTGSSVLLGDRIHLFDPKSDPYQPPESTIDPDAI